MTYPATLASLALWLDGTAPAWSDAGASVPATAPAGRVRRIDQPSPLSGSWLAASDAARPFRETAAVDCQIGAIALCMQAPVGTTLPGNACTLMVSWTARSVNNLSPFGLLFDTEQALLTGADSGGKFGVFLYSNRIVVYQQNTIWDPFSGGTPTAGAGVPCTATVTFKSTGITLKYNFGGVAGSASLSVSIPASTVTNLQIGTPGIRIVDSYVDRLHASVAQAVGVARSCTGTEEDNLLAFGVVNRPEPYPLAAPFIAVVGDSIAEGWTLYQRDQAWSFLMLPNLYAAAPVRLLNTAIAGWTMAQIAADFPGSVQPFISGSRDKNIVIVEGGSNSLYFGASAATTLAQKLALCDAARAAGAFVVVDTLLPRSDGGTPGTFETDRQTVNAGIRAASSRYDALADVGNDPVMGQFGDSNDRTYYGDQGHATIFGHVTLESTYRAAVLSVLLTVPLAPSGLTLHTVTANSVNVAWTDNATNETGYHVYYSANGVKPGAPQVTLPSGSTVTTVGGLSAGSTYTFWVEAFNATGASASITGSIFVPSPAPTAGKVQMQGVDVATQSLVTWLADGADWTGVSAPRPVTDVILYTRTRVH